MLQFLTFFIIQTTIVDSHIKQTTDSSTSTNLSYTSKMKSFTTGFVAFIAVAAGLAVAHPAKDTTNNHANVSRTNETNLSHAKRQWGSGDPITGEVCNSKHSLIAVCLSSSSKQATYYYQEGGYGACGAIHSDYDQIVALPADFYSSDKCGKVCLI